MSRLTITLSLLSLYCCSAAFANPSIKWDDRIIGGKNAEIEDFPYQASLQFLDDHYCGAAIISENYVLTAAHCTHENLPRFLSVKVGVTDVTSSNGQTVKVKKVISHPNFNKFSNDYDVSILVLETPLKFNASVQKIRLPSAQEEVEVGTAATISGWGKLAEGGSRSNILKQVDMHVISEDSCQMIYGNIISDRMICAAEPEGGKDACQGDSGGPMAIDGKLVGIVSWGVGCGRPGKAGVFTRVSAIRNFIYENTSI